MMVVVMGEREDGVMIVVKVDGVGERCWGET